MLNRLKTTPSQSEVKLQFFCREIGAITRNHWLNYLLLFNKLVLSEIGPLISSKISGRREHQLGDRNIESAHA
jgi:hypothetical protein